MWLGVSPSFLHRRFPDTTAVRPLANCPRSSSSLRLCLGFYLGFFSPGSKSSSGRTSPKVAVGRLVLLKHQSGCGVPSCVRSRKGIEDASHPSLFAWRSRLAAIAVDARVWRCAVATASVGPNQAARRDGVNAALGSMDILKVAQSTSVVVSSASIFRV